MPEAMSPKTLEFKAELKQVLDIIIHSLYSNKEIFLRELISNACDAIDKIRFNSLTDSDLLEGDDQWKIKITPDAEAGTLTVSDNGIGMSAESIIDDLGTIARSGTREFLQTLRNAEARERPELIGQFGVGFYSAFMVADKVSVLSRTAGTTEAVRWESDGQGTYTLEPGQRDRRGTDIILHLREEDREFLEPHRIRAIVKTYSDYVEHPIVMDTTVTGPDQAETVEEQRLNSGKALWLRPKSDIKAEEYTEFYRQIARDFTDPLETVHYHAEGTLEFKALMFLPSHAPVDLHWGQARPGLRLYIQRVLIQDPCEALLPGYLRFVKGVVDSSDLPLNVSRETLQHSPLLVKIKNSIVTRLLKALDELRGQRYDDYVKFFQECGTILKEGVSQDWSNRETVAGLLLFESTATEPGTFTTLDQYIGAMPEDQEAIYYLIGESRTMIAQSPYLEAFKDRGHAVLLMTDPIDEFLVDALHEYKGKKLKAVDKGELPAAKDADKEDEQVRTRLASLFEHLEKHIEEVEKVRVSNRLRDSAACLVVEEGAMGAHMERLMHRIGRREEPGTGKRILELNPNHPTVQALHALFEASPDDPRVIEGGRLLHDQAVIAEGSRIADPAAFARRINDLLVRVFS